MTPSPDQADVARKLASPSGLVQGLCNIGGDPIVLDPWQAHFCDTERRFTVWNKGRQGGASFSAACRAWSRCYLSAPGTYLAILTSYNLEDAKEKIRYVKALDKCLPIEARLGGRSGYVWAKTELEFANGNRIVTMFLPRGKGPADVMIDEMAHMQEARAIYQAALPVVSRGGSILVFSTPLAQHGMFADIWTNAENRFPKYKRIEIPWWICSALCTDVATATVEAPDMTTEQRVERFGTPALEDICGNMFLEDFRTEYECAWTDESAAAIPWELIEICSPTGEGRAVELVAPPTHGYQSALAAVAELRRLDGDLYAGMDFGRKIDATELKVGEQLVKGGRIEERLTATLRNCPFQQQWAVLERVCSLPRMRKVVLDHNGLGMPLSEQAKTNWPNRVISQVLSRTTKPEIFNHTRAMMERGFFAFYPDRDTRQQFHSIKKHVTAHGNITYDVDRNEKHHADKFWSAALMLWGAADSMSLRAPGIFTLSARDPEIGPSEIPFSHGITIDPRENN